MERSCFCRRVTLMAVLMTLACGSAVAQWSQAQVCPGWNNPTNFTAMGAGLYSGTFYQGCKGDKEYNNGKVPNAATGETDVTWGAIIANTAMASTTSDVGGDAAIFPSNHETNYNFAIYTPTDQCSGYTANRDPNTGSNLWYVPTFYNTDDPHLSVQTNLQTSIRVGTGRGRPSSSGGYTNSTALYYNLQVRPENAMLYLYYACVFESPTHGAGSNPAFMIRVQKQINGVWRQVSPTGTYPATSATDPHECDTLAYFINSYGLQNNVNGWHNVSVGSQSIFYKDWAKVAIDLSGCMYSKVRVEVMVSGCDQMQHYAYAYICGECRPMKITGGGCPAGTSPDVTTLAAPYGLDNYVWYRSQYGAYGTSDGIPSTTMTLPDSDEESTAYYTFFQLTPNSGTHDSAYRYKAQAEDFRIPYRRNAAHVQEIPTTPEEDGGDSLGNKQIFLCEVTSAVNPAKPFKSKIYTIVQNLKPTMDVKIQPYCGGDVDLVNKSYVTGNSTIVAPDSTVWKFYDNPNCMGLALDSITGNDSVTYHFDGSTVGGVRVITNINENDGAIANSDRPAHNTCYSEATYPITPLPNPVAAIAVTPEDHVLCDDATATLRDVTSGSTYRVWRFRDTAENSSMELVDTLVGAGDANRQVSRAFTHGTEPFELTVRNGLFYLNPENLQDTIWCVDTARDVISVFLHPDLTVVGDSIVCMGDVTDVTVSAGVDSCTYQWSTSPTSIQGGFPEGPHLAVAPYADTATYYVRVRSKQGCEAWGSARAYRVNPRLSMLPLDGNICPGQEVTLKGSNAHHYSWTATPADPSLVSQSSAETVVVTPQRSTTYTLVGHGSNDCNASPLTAQVTVFPYPESTVELEPGIVDSENPTVTLRDVSPYSVATMWTFAAGEMVPGREVTHTFGEATGVDSVYVTLTNVNELGCESVYPFSIPVHLYTAWFPNIFTPGSEDENSRFRLYTINTYDHFHIYIYNRFGQLVFDSSDPSFEWNGTTEDGLVCPQGTYTYICRYRKPGAYTVNSLYGSITLVR